MIECGGTNPRIDEFMKAVVLDNIYDRDVYEL